MARTPVLAAGGIVMQRSETPLIAVVRLRKRNDWVLPKGKLNTGETALAAAEREVLEETGHQVTIHEFIGTLAYEAGGRPKIVHFWRMEADAEPTHELMADVKAVAWLPLDEAVERLSRGYEQAFLAHVGPLAMEARAAGRAASNARPPAAAPAVPGPITEVTSDAAATAGTRIGATREAAVSSSDRPWSLLRQAWGWLRQNA